MKMKKSAEAIFKEIKNKIGQEKVEGVVMDAMKD